MRQNNELIRGKYRTFRILMAVCAAAGVILSVWMRNAVFFVAGVMSFLMFLDEYRTLYNQEKDGKIQVYCAVAVSKENTWSAQGGWQWVYRLIPIDEQGRYLDENGSLDIFIARPRSVQPKKDAMNGFVIGCIYEMAFVINEENGALDEHSLIAYKRQKSGAQK